MSSEHLEQLLTESLCIGTDNINTINIVDAMLNKNVLTSFINRNITDDDVASANIGYSYFDYSLNETLSVNQILESCRDFKKRKKKSDSR